MSPISLALLIFALMLGLMALRLPIALAMFVAGAAGYILQSGLTPLLFFLNTEVYSRLTSTDLAVIPLFILMGQLATQGGLSKALFAFAAAIMGRFKGGLAMASIGASAAFGAICGSSVATAATITSVALPEMKAHGYSGRFATGSLAAGGTLGILIPPSVPLIIYAILTEQNVAKLFAAAFIPGLIAMFGYLVAIYVYVRLVPGECPEVDDVRPSATWPTLLWGVLPIFVIFLLVFGGIYGGFFTPNEGASIGTVLTFIVALLKGELTLNKLLNACLMTAESSAMIFLIFVGADIMNSALAMTQVPVQLAEVVSSMGLSPILVVIGIVIFYNILGSVMDELSMILLTIPIFFPIIMKLNFGLPPESVAIWFGIIVLMTIGFGMLAPPVGLNVFVVNGLAKNLGINIPIKESYRGIMPFLITDVLRITLLILVPSITLWAVQYVG